MVVLLWSGLVMVIYALQCCTAQMVLLIARTVPMALLRLSISFIALVGRTKQPKHLLTDLLPLNLIGPVTQFSNAIYPRVK
uniref:Putative secreted protein n=1 Tax=Ixodes ricinus TaxID=34613 RepID=A0A6B0TW52_IXORI